MTPAQPEPTTATSANSGPAAHGRGNPNEEVVHIHDFAANGIQPHHYSLSVDDLRNGNHPASVTEVPARFRWIHLPVNDTELVKACLEKLVPRREGAPDEDIGSLLEKSWLRNIRPAASLPESIIPRHSRCMEPSCELHPLSRNDAPQSEEFEPSAEQHESPKGEAVSIFLPYLNWETFDKIQTLHQKHNKTETSPAGETPESGEEAPTESRPTLHHRRTLDQFYYTGLDDTRTRDAGQTISRWTGTDEENQEMNRDGRRSAVPTSLVVMVDQMWLWIVNKDMVLSCFPLDRIQIRTAEGEATAADSGSIPFADVYTSSKQQLRQCEDVYDLAALLVRHAVAVLFEQKNKKLADLLGIYQWAIGKKTARQTENFEAFSRNQSDLSSDAPELRLALEIADIQDELNMLATLLDKQNDVLVSLRNTMLALNSKPMALQSVSPQLVHIKARQERGGVIKLSLPPSAQCDVELGQERGGVLHVETAESTSAVSMAGIGGHAGHWLEQAAKELHQTMDEVKRLQGDAKNTYRMLLSLLDLKQKAAALDEARSSTKQGRAVMLFTIVTIIFLPLSFFTSYFGQNVFDITGDEKNPKSTDLWKIGAPISVVVIISALLVAFSISNPDSSLWKPGLWKQKAIKIWQVDDLV